MIRSTCPHCGCRMGWTRDECPECHRNKNEPVLTP